MWTKEHIKKTANWYLDHYLIRHLPPLFHLRWMFKNKVGYRLNLEHPRTFSEKIQWLKIESKNHPEYTQMVDKATAKDYVANIIGKEYIIPTHGIWDSVNDIDWSSLPNQFVLKATGDSGSIVICKDKSLLNINEVKKILEKKGNEDYSKYNLEYPYRNVPHRYIAEAFIENADGGDLKDYKFFCFNGVPQYCQVIGERSTGMVVDFFDMDWNHMPFHEPKYTKFADYDIPMPINYGKMISLASKLATGKPFSRIDFYNIEGKIYFGEITFFPTSGMGGFDPVEWDYKLGEMIKLTNRI